MAIRGHDLARPALELHALLGEIGLNEFAIAAARNKTDLLAFRLFGHRQPLLAGDRAHPVLSQLAQREDRARELLLRQAEEEIGLVLGAVHGREQLIPARGFVAPDARVVAGSDAVRADLERGLHKLLKLDLGVAPAAGDGRRAREIPLDEGAHHVLFEALLKVDDVIRNAQEIRHTARVVDVVERAAAAAGASGRACALVESLQARQAPLVPELHGQTYDSLGAIGRSAGGLTRSQRIVLGENGGDSRAVNAATHRHCDSHGNKLSAFSFQQPFQTS